MKESLAIDCTNSDTMMNYELYAYKVTLNKMIENLLREMITSLLCFHLEKSNEIVLVHCYLYTQL